MQTLAQVISKVSEMMDEDEGMEFLFRTVKELYGSKAINIEEFEDDYALPKMLLSEALRRLGKQYEPLDDSYKKESQNLKYA